MGALRQILCAFDISINTAELDAGQNKIGKFIEGLTKVGVAVAGLAAIKKIANFAEGIAEGAREVEFSAAKMEMGVESYQRLRQVANDYGMSVEQVQIATTLFTRALGNAGGVAGITGHTTGRAAEAFKLLGLNAAQFKGQKLEDILPTISDAMLKIDDPMKKLSVGLALFGHRGRAILPLMAQGGDKIRASFAAALPIFEEATIEAADKATIAGKTLGRTWSNLINNSFGKAAMESFARLADKLTVVIQGIKELSKNSQIGQAVLIAFGVAAGAFGAWLAIAFWPVTLAVAAFAALALAIDDVLVFMHGGHSVIGAFFNELFGEGGAEKARTKIKELWEEFKVFAADMLKFGKGDFAKDMREGLHDMLQAVREIKAIMAWISEKWETSKGLFDSFGHKLGGGSTGPKDKLASDWHPAAAIATIDAPASITGGLGPSESSGSPAPTPGFVPGQGMTIHISGSIAADEVARTVPPIVQEIHSKAWRDALAGMGGAK